MSLNAPKLSPESTWIDTVHNDFAQANFDFEESGVWYEEVLEFIPLSQIERKECWNPQRCKDCYEKLKATGAMPPVRLSPNESSTMHSISNGIHRCAAARALGYEAVPAIVSHARKTPPPEDPGTDLKRSQNYGWNLAIKIKPLVNTPCSFDVKEIQPGGFSLIIEREENERDLRYVAKTTFKDRVFLSTLSGDASGQIGGSFDELAAGIAALINGPSIKAWILRSCKFAFKNS